MLLPPTWILDACSALNLVASGRFEAILQTPFNGHPLSYRIADVAAREAASLRRGGDEDADEREPIDWGSLFSSGIIKLESAATSTEIAAYVALTAHIDDGEAMTLALASARGYGVVTDDRKAKRFLGGVPCLGTLDLVHNWSVIGAVTQPVLGSTLRAITERANFAAPRAHPLRDWWNRTLQAT